MKMKLPSSVSKVLTNKYFLYFILFLAVTNILGYMVTGNIAAMVFFALVAYITHRFTKNMAIVLGVALFVTGFLMIGKTVKEGLENQQKEEVKEKVADVKQTVKTTSPSNTDAHTALTTAANSIAAAAPAASAQATAAPATAPATSSTSATTSPATSTATTSTEGLINNKKPRIDYATTLEEAYGDLNNILGGDGIKRLTDDTQRLMTQQLQLADAMKSMSPLLENAKTMLQGFDLKNLDGLASLAKNLGKQ
jgi:cytoskeletal protein RodZ